MVGVDDDNEGASGNDGPSAHQKLMKSAGAKNVTPKLLNAEVALQIGVVFVVCFSRTKFQLVE